MVSRAACSCSSTKGNVTLVAEVSESDSGVLYLIDDRFAQREVQNLLPRWWQALSR